MHAPLNLEVTLYDNQKVCLSPLSGGWKAFLWDCQLREEIGQRALLNAGKTVEGRGWYERLLHLGQRDPLFGWLEGSIWYVPYAYVT